MLLVALLVLGLPPSARAAKARPKVQAKPPGVVHVVEAGQTLFRISLAYQVKVERLMEANRLKPSSSLRVGQGLFVPGAKAVKPVAPSRALTPAEREALERSLSGETSTTAPPPAPPRPLVKTDADFVWPIVGPINSPFGPRRGRFHAGIDIGSPHYQEVVAGADGEVIYANETQGALGKAIVLQHGHGFRTVYAHLSIIIAAEGDTVRQGAAIGGVGDTGRATGPHLHFEVRRYGAALNPEDYLPATIDELVQDLSRKR
ncbi:MAG TPA: peptidoglycan DD-metalloendopeptidase family protein [Candidatus Methylomirabilis sp.]|nr:peptidoglycan DD-metalloendopeptidase family protein [Candidatus Methylomirabilis sp.]